MHLFASPKLALPESIALPHRTGGGWVTSDLPALVIAPAVTMNQHRACNGLVRRMYAWRGYRHLTTRHRIGDPLHVTFGAWLDGDLVATLTVSRDSKSSLMAYSLYGHELDRFRKPGHVLCEVTRLAVDVDCHDPDLLKNLFQSAYQYARAVFGATDAVIEVNPRHASYYRRALAFQQIGPMRTCPRVEAPAVLLHRSMGSHRL